MKIRAILLIAAVLVVIVTVALGVYGAYAIRSLNVLINTIYDKALMTSTFSQARLSAASLIVMNCCKLNHRDHEMARIPQQHELHD